MNASKKIRVMLVVPMLDQGGLERVCALTSQLLQNKYEVYVVVFNGIGRIYDVSGAELIDLGLGAVSNKWGKLLQVVKRAARLSKIVKEKKIQIVYSFGRTANIACSLIYTKVKKICACHSHEEIKNIKYLKLMDKRADIILCCSKAMAKEVGTCIGSDKVKPVWNPCDIQDIQQLAEVSLPAFQEFFLHHNKIIVAMGREDDVKGYWHLIKAFRRIWENNNSVGLVIIGNGEFTEYRELARNLQIEQDILFTGVQKNPFCYLKKSNVLVLSSLSEGLPNTLVEAMAVGLPVVSVNCQSGPAEILEDEWDKVDTDSKIYKGTYGILTMPFNDEKDMMFDLRDNKIQLSIQEMLLSDAVWQILQNEQLEHKYIQAGLERCNDFSKEAYYNKIVNCFEQVVNENEENIISY